MTCFSCIKEGLKVKSLPKALSPPYHEPFSPSVLKEITELQNIKKSLKEIETKFKKIDEAEK